MASTAMQRTRYVFLIGTLLVVLYFYLFYEPVYEEHVGPQQRIVQPSGEKCHIRRPGIRGDAESGTPAFSP